MPHHSRRALGKASLICAIALTVAMLTIVAPPSVAVAPSGVTSPSAAPDSNKIQPKLVRKFEESDAARQTFWVRFDTSADLSGAKQIDDWAERGEYVVRQLKATANDAQADAIDLLDARGATYEAFWASNAIRVKGGSYALARALADRPEVERVSAPEKYTMTDTIVPEPEQAAGEMSPASVAWGVTNINADDVWAKGFDGGGIVIANIDTGVQFDHPTLINQYRGNNGNGSFTHDFNWFDASGNCDGAPCDVNGHGTHTMGTMVGDDGATHEIGVAPGATWITANGCDACTAEDLMESAQWMLAPTRLDGTGADPAMRPNIINNSWGSQSPNSTDPWFDDISLAWEAAGIFGVFSNGNNGSGCKTSGSPGSRTVNYSVGAYDASNTIADFSSRGAGQDGEIKPNISAPGVAVYSAYPGDRYATGDGTSMAAPHLAGAIGLAWSAGPELVGDIAATRQLLNVTAVDTADSQCGGTSDDNNVFGEGRLDALPLVSGRQVSFLTGQVTSQATGEPVSGVRVRMVGGSTDSPVDRTVVTDPEGRYQAGLLSGDYQMTVWGYGYLPQTADVTVAETGTTIRDFALEDAPMTAVTGRVSDGSGHGWGLHAKITVEGVEGHEPVYSDPVTGSYTLKLPSAATYDLSVDPVYAGYPTTADTIEVGEVDISRDYAMSADLEACVSPGYGWDGVSSTFDGWTATTPEDGWQIDDKKGSWRFDNPENRQQPQTSGGAFALADPAADAKGRLDTTLTSPAIDLTGHSAPELTLAMRYLGAARQSAAISYSTDGQQWSTIWSGTTDHTVGVMTYALPAAAGQEDVRLRFTFRGSGDTYWGIDNVFVGTHDCVPLDGGLIVGDVSDQASGDPVEGARVYLESAPEGFVRSENVDGTGARFWLFAPPGELARVVAQRHGYDQYAAGVDVAPDQITQHDIQLASAS